MICPKCNNEGVLVPYMIGGDSWYCRQCKTYIELSEAPKENIFWDGGVTVHDANIQAAIDAIADAMKLS